MRVCAAAGRYNALSPEASRASIPDMSHSVPDICDDFIDEVSVFDPQFHDFGGRRKFGGEIVTIRCFEDNSLVGETVRQPGHGRVIVVDGGGLMH